MGSGLVYTAERRPRRPGGDEMRRGQTRTSYTGDDLFISVARPAHVQQSKPIRRLDIRALVSNRDLPIFDDQPRLTVETGDPVARVELLSAMRRPRASLAASLPQVGRDGEAAFDDLTWRLVAQLSLNHLSLAEESRGAEPCALCWSFTPTGAIRRWPAPAVIDRRGQPAGCGAAGPAGPLCWARGRDYPADRRRPLSGHSVLLLSALLSRLFARHASINAFVRTRTRLQQRQEEVSWPMRPGNRDLI